MKVLLIDESAMVARQLRDRLVAVESSTTGALHAIVDLETDYQLALEKLAEPEAYDAVIIEPYPFDQPAEMVRRIFRRLRATRTITIAVTSAFTVERCVETMRAGARDFFVKSRPINDLVTAILSLILRESETVGVPDLDARWVGRQLMRLSASYPGQWIAVAKRRLLAHAETRAELIEMLKDCPPEPPPKVWRLPVEWGNDDVF